MDTMAAVEVPVAGVPATVVTTQSPAAADIIIPVAARAAALTAEAAAPVAAVMAVAEATAAVAVAVMAGVAAASAVGMVITKLRRPGAEARPAYLRGTQRTLVRNR